MNDTYFSDRELGPKPRTEEAISTTVWGGILAIIESFIANVSFGASFPDECPDGAGACGVDRQNFWRALRAEIPEVSWPLDENQPPSILAILDLIEFCHLHVAKPIQHDYHSFFRHHHLSFNREEGQTEFRDKINRIFARNGIVYEIKEDGKVIRLAPPILREAIVAYTFNTGDVELDSMLETARRKFLDTDPNIRRESLEKLWDAWERLKTIEQGKDKKESILRLLEKASPEERFRQTLEQEARELTTIGNSFQIRHSEISQVPIALSEHIDYLFHRLFAMIRLLIARR